MILLVAICVISLGTFAQSHDGSSAIVSRLSASQVTTELPPISPLDEIPRNKEPKVSTKNLLKELGNNHRQIIEESIFNETESVKICWNKIIYVNDSNGVATPWFEYQVVFHFPNEDDQPKDQSSKKFVRYGIKQNENDRNNEPHNFEVLESHPNYTVSKNVTSSCGKGSFLTKSYYEWPKADKKKLVLRLTDKYSSFSYDRHDFVDENVTVQHADDILGSSKLASDSLMSGQEHKNNTSQEDSMMEGDDNGILESKESKREAQNKGPTDINIGTTYNPDDLEITTKSQNNNSDEVEDRLTTESSLSNEDQNSTFLQNKVIASLDPCSPFLTQLLSADGILPGLCNLRKNESLLLQGNILVSKRYFDKENKTNVIKPMFMIRENTQIEQASSQEANNETQPKGKCKFC